MLFIIKFIFIMSSMCDTYNGFEKRSIDLEQHDRSKRIKLHTFDISHWAPYVHPDDLPKLQTFVDTIGNGRYGKLLVLYGTGSNGKTTFVNELSRYVDVKHAPITPVIKSSNRSIVSDVHHYIGNCVILQEADKDDKIKEEFIQRCMLGLKTELYNGGGSIETTRFENCNMMYLANTLNNVQHMLDDPTMSQFVDVIRFTHTFCHTYEEYNINSWKQYIHAEDFDELKQFTHNVVNNIKHPKIMVFFGTGSNGKSRFIEVLSRRTQVTHVGFPTRYPNEFEATLYTQKLVVINHSDEHNITSFFGILKSFYEGDAICCRKLYEEHKYIRMYGNMIIVLNSQTALDEMLSDNSIERRIKVVRFIDKFQC